MQQPSTLALQLKAEMLVQQGRLDEAIAEAERARWGSTRTTLTATSLWRGL
jgi:hypothetical protein